MRSGGQKPLVVGRYSLPEPDAAAVRRLARSADRLHSSIWCLAEVACVFHRHVREKSLTHEQAAQLQKAFQLDVEKRVWELLPVTEALLHRVETLVEFSNREPGHGVIAVGRKYFVISSTFSFAAIINREFAASTKRCPPAIQRCRMRLLYL